MLDILIEQAEEIEKVEESELEVEHEPRQELVKRAVAATLTLLNN